MTAKREDMTEGAYIVAQIRARCHEAGDCLVWDGYLNGDSPRITIDRVHRPVRQLMFEQAVGHREMHNEVIHTCGTRSCVAPAHLEQVSPAERRRRTALSRYVSTHTGEAAPLFVVTEELAEIAIQKSETTRARGKANAAVLAARSGAIPNSVFALGGRMTFTLNTCRYDDLGPNSPFVRSNCRACTLRSFAAGPLYHSSSQLGMLTPAYRNALKAAFEGEEPAAVHAEVRAVHERISNEKAQVL